MSVKFSPWGNQQFFDANGNPAVGHKIKTYAAGSSTRLATYTDSTGTVSQSADIILNSLGLPTLGQIWLTAGLSYKLVWTDSADVVLKTEDNISGVNDASNTTSQWQASGVTPTYISASSFTLVGDQTTEFHVGRRLQFTTTAGTVYGTIAASAYTVLTTITMAMGSAQSLDAGLSAVSISILRADNPALPGMINESRATVVGHATTAPIWTAAGNSIDLTGTPTYTAFPAAPQAGAKRRLYPAAGAIFTHGGAFDIVGNANFTAAAGDIVDVEAITTTNFRLIPIKESGEVLSAALASTAEVQAGVNAAKAVTPATMAASALGAGQTWQNVTGSRASGTTYTNSTGRPIQISLTIVGDGAAISTFAVSGVTVASILQAATARSPINVIIPNGATYLLTLSTNTVANWAELR